MKSLYLAKIVYRITNSGSHTIPQFEEQLKIVEAATFDEAWDKSIALGYSGETSFANVSDHVVSWQFVNVCELYLLKGLADGMEVYSRIEEPADENSYVRLVNAK